MKILTNTNFIKKLIIAIVCTILLNFCFTYNVSYGVEVAIDTAQSFGGKLMPYIVDFATAIADVFGSLVQFGLTGEYMNATEDKGSAIILGNGTEKNRRKRLLGRPK